MIVRKGSLPTFEQTYRKTGIMNNTIVLPDPFCEWNKFTTIHTDEGFACFFLELAFNTGQFARSAAMLGNAEENTALSRALSQLAEIEEKVDQLHLDQADMDFFVLAELVKDYIMLIGAIKVRLRGNHGQNWK